MNNFCGTPVPSQSAPGEEFFTGNVDWGPWWKCSLPPGHLGQHAAYSDHIIDSARLAVCWGTPYVIQEESL